LQGRSQNRRGKRCRKGRDGVPRESFWCLKRCKPFEKGGETFWVKKKKREWQEGLQQTTIKHFLTFPFPVRRGERGGDDRLWGRMKTCAREKVEEECCVAKSKTGIGAESPIFVR